MHFVLLFTLLQPVRGKPCKNIGRNNQRHSGPASNRGKTWVASNKETHLQERWNNKNVPTLTLTKATSSAAKLVNAIDRAKAEPKGAVAGSVR